jgi:hypothetical protein
MKVSTTGPCSRASRTAEIALSLIELGGVVTLGDVRHSENAEGVEDHRGPPFLADAGGSATGLSATDARGLSLGR